MGSFLFHRFSLTTIVIALLLAVSISPALARKKGGHRRAKNALVVQARKVLQPLPLTKLAETICNNFNDVEDHGFCVAVLGSPQARAAGEDPKALIKVVLNLASMDANASIEQTKVLMSNQDLTFCVQKFESAVRSFNMLPQEVDDGDSTASYDIKVNTDKADECDSYMMRNKIAVPKINERTRCLRRFAMIGYFIAASYEE